MPGNAPGIFNLKTKLLIPNPGAGMQRWLVRPRTGKYTNNQVISRVVGGGKWAVAVGG